MDTAQTSAAGAALVAPRFNPWSALSWLGIMVMETTWIALVFSALSSVTAAVPFGRVVLIVAAALLVSYLSESVLLRLEPMIWLERGTRLGFVLLLILLGNLVLFAGAEIPPAESGTVLRGIDEFTRLVPAEWLFALTAVWTWWRGMTIARKGVGTFAVIRHLRIDTGAYVVFSLLALSSSLDLPGVEMFILFLFAALVALSAARVSVLGKFRGGRRNPFNRAWLISIFLAVFATMGVGISIAMLFTGRLFSFWRGVVALVFTGAVTLVMAPFLFLISLFSNADIGPGVLPTPTPMPRFLSPFEEDAGFIPNFVDSTAQQVEIVPADLRPLLYLGSALLASILLVLMVAGIFYTYRRRRGDSTIEYAVQPGDWLGLLRRELRREADELRPRADHRLGRRERRRAAEKIRRIYADLMDLLEAIDSPRPGSQTPLEFLPTMQAALPGLEGDLATITYAYLQIRYGELPEQQSEVNQVEQAWSRVRRKGDQLRKIVEARKREEEKERKRREKAN